MTAHAENDVYMKRESAAVLGFFAAPIVPAAYLAIAFPLSGERDAVSIAGTFYIVYFSAAIANLFLGLPLLVGLSRLNLVRWWSAVFSGAFVGIVAILAVRFSVNIETETLLRVGVMGGIAGFVFWIIWQTGDET